MSAIQGSLRISVAAFALAIGTVSPAIAQSRISLPSASLEDSLNRLSRQAGVQILVNQTLVKGKKASAISGAASAESALHDLLRGSGLTYEKRDGTFLVVRGGSSRPAQVASAASMATTAMASEPEDEPANEIIVTGTKKRLSASPQDEKQMSIAFVATVGSEEMAKRTDTSVVAALERLPGVVRQRGTQTSQAWYPAIRGFSGWYNSVSIDGGMLYLSTRNQRGVPLDFIPTAVVNELVVSKTVTPEMDANSIGGHIDVRTLRSFDNDGQPLTMLDTQGVFYSQPGSLNNANPSYAINGVIKRTFGPDGNFGFVLGGSTHKDQYSEKINNSSGFVQRDGVDIPSGNLQRGNYNSRAHGLSLMGKLEGRGDKWYGYVAGNYFRERIWRDLTRSNVSIVPANVTNVADGTGSFTGATPTALSQIYYNDRKVFSVRGGLEYQTGETSKIVANASYLDANFGEGFWTGGSFTPGTVSGTYNVTDRTPGTTISSAVNLNDPTRWMQAAGTVATQEEYPLSTRIVTGRIEFKSNNFDFSDGIGFDVGVDYRRMWRKLSQYQDRSVLASAINVGQVLDDRSTFNGANPAAPIYIDQNKYYNLMRSLGTTTRVYNDTANYDLDETVIAPFAALYYTTETFRVIAGVRYNITDYDNSVATITNGAITPLNTSRRLPYLLPNVQGYYNLGGGFRVRAAYTETTALQNYGDFATGITTNVDGKGNPYVQGANPLLKPRLSFNEDVSLEWYGDKGYVSLGYFHKTVKNEAVSIRQENYDSNGVLISTTQQPVNAGSANVHGIEFESQIRDLTGISPLLRGLTVDLNGAWFASTTDLLVSQGVTRSLDGFRQQPKWVTNLILTYDNGPFSASLIGMTRGKALLSITSTPATDVYLKPFSTLDAKIGYQLTRNVKLYAEGRNLTNYWYKEVTGVNSDKISTAIQGGRTFIVGAKMTF
ncbi:TonB-dependent receptor [Sphingobium aquiterrae]|uniref:TonB-dependent receptor n=1 Tax=Sphingobium aquiterrae TaxID=2038656 RepID=UPI003018BF27